MKRDASKVIWRTVVFAGAMLGAPACTKNKTQTTTPSNTAQTKPADGTNANGTAPNTANTAAQTPADPSNGAANPCGAAPDPRPRGTDDETGGSMGRGFVLS